MGARVALRRSNLFLAPRDLRRIVRTSCQAVASLRHWWLLSTDYSSLVKQDAPRPASRETFSMSASMRQHARNNGYPKKLAKAAWKTTLAKRNCLPQFSQSDRFLVFTVAYSFH